MSKVLIEGSIGAVLVYIIIGIFGYLIFVDKPWIISENVLEIKLPLF